MSLEKFRTVDLIVDHSNDQTFIPKQYASSGDIAGHTTTLQITENGLVKELSGIGATAAWYNKASGQTGIDDFELIDKTKNIMRWTYPQSMLTAGTVEVVISIQYQGHSTDLRKFTIEVQQVNGQFAGIVSSEAYKALTSALARLSEYDTKIESVVSGLAGKANETDFFQAQINLANPFPFEEFASEDELKQKYPNGKNGKVIVTKKDGTKSFFMFVNGKWSDFGSKQSSKKATINLGFGLNASAERFGDFVFLNVAANQTISISQTYTTPSEKIPSGFRPNKPLILDMVITVGKTYQYDSQRIQILREDGTMEIYAKKMSDVPVACLGSAFYITNDPLV